MHAKPHLRWYKHVFVCHSNINWNLPGFSVKNACLPWLTRNTRFCHVCLIDANHALSQALFLVKFQALLTFIDVWGGGFKGCSEFLRKFIRFGEQRRPYLKPQYFEIFAVMSILEKFGNLGKWLASIWSKGFFAVMGILENLGKWLTCVWSQGWPC